MRDGDAALAASTQDARDAYRAALDDDLNLPEGLGQVFELVREANAALDAGRAGPAARQALLDLLAGVDAHLGVLREEAGALDPAVEQLIPTLGGARRALDLAPAERTPDQL